MKHIICVKIHQPTYISSTYIFPFDRIYIVPTETVPRLTTLFDYYLSMPLDTELKEKLQRLYIENHKVSSIFRDTRVPFNGKEYHYRLNEDSILIIPTHLKPINDNFSEIAYHVSRIVNQIVNPGHLRNQLPSIQFHTPTRTYPMLCTACINMSDYTAGKCSPGHRTCYQNFLTEFPNPHAHKVVNAKAAEEVGTCA